MRVDPLDGRGKLVPVRILTLPYEAERLRSKSRALVE